MLRDQHADALPILHALMKQLGNRPPRAPPPGEVGACARRIHVTGPLQLLYQAPALQRTAMCRRVIVGAAASDPAAVQRGLHLPPHAQTC